MRVLIGCEHSGVVREAFRARGHDAWSCDLLPASDGSPHHFTQDLFRVASHQWDLAIVHPPCTYISVSGQHWCSRGRIEPDGRPRTFHRDEALTFVRKLWSLPIQRLALENPVGILNTVNKALPQPQYMQPYEFGDDASKKTGLWLRGLPWLTIDPAARKPGRWVTHQGKRVERWSNQTDSGQNVLGPTNDIETRRSARAVTYPGIAQAMARQWGNLDPLDDY